MKIFCFCGRRRIPFVPLILAAVLAVLLIISVGPAASATEEHGTTAAAEHGEGEAARAPGWVATDTYRLLHFIVLAGGLYFLLRKPLSQALRSRVKGIEDKLGELEAQKEAAEQKLAEYNRKFAQLEKESAAIVAEYVRQGEEARARILKEAESAAEKLKVQAQKNIETEIQRTKSQLQAEIFGMALVKAEALIKEKINAEDQEKLVDEYLAKVVAS